MSRAREFTTGRDVAILHKLINTRNEITYPFQESIKTIYGLLNGIILLDFKT